MVLLRKGQGLAHLCIMNLDLDKAIQELSIMEDVPLILPNQEKFCSIERNNCSLLGRFLNPSHQRMSNWILDMPRIWRLYSRVRGVALSQERFQFLFKSEDDLLEILKTGVWTQDEWCVIMDRWVEKPKEDYLMFLPVWIRLRNIPVNYYTSDTIKEIASCVGKVLKVELDLEKSQAQDYVRVQVLFDVRNPLRNCKEVLIPTGEVVSVTFDYERIRKRCFLCQRLTHEKGDCPFSQQRNKSNFEKIIRDAGLKTGELVSETRPKILSLPSPSMVPVGSNENRDLFNWQREKDAQDSSPYPASPAPLNELSKELQRGLFPFKAKLRKSHESEALSGFLEMDLSSDPKTTLEEASSSGLSIRQKNPRKRKVYTLRKKSLGREDLNLPDANFIVQGDTDAKRRNQAVGSGISQDNKGVDSTVVPCELPQYQ